MKEFVSAAQREAKQVMTNRSRQLKAVQYQRHSTVLYDISETARDVTAGSKSCLNSLYITSCMKRKKLGDIG